MRCSEYVSCWVGQARAREAASLPNAAYESVARRLSARGRGAHGGQRRAWKAAHPPTSNPAVASKISDFSSTASKERGNSPNWFEVPTTQGGNGNVTQNRRIGR